jgi:acyl-CoA hydrolase
VNNIVPYFKPGTQVSLGCNVVNWVVTEFGAVNLKGKAFWERVELLASIAHPDFKDEIFHAAEEAKIWRATDKVF